MSLVWRLMGRHLSSLAASLEYTINVSLTCLVLGFPRTSPLVGLRGGWGALVLKLKTSLWQLKKKAKLQDKNHQEGKRPLSDSESETEPSTYSTFSIHFPTFIVIESKDPSHPVTKLSPFVVEKQLHSILGTAKSVRKLKNNTILVECFTRQQSENLLKHKKFFQLDVNIYPHKTLNFSKGVVRCKELSLCSSPSRTGGRIRRLPSCRVVKPHQWTCSFAVSCDLCHLMKGSWWLKHTTLAWS